MNRQRRGFTLIELLVVIGIIALLMTILVPVISRIRVSAQTTSTTSQMHRIAMSLTNYYNDFQAYPGAHSNADWAKGLVAARVSGLTNFTQTEDCVIGLLGGFQASAATLTFYPMELGMGPMTYNTATGIINKRFNAYMEFRPEDFTPNYKREAPIAYKSGSDSTVPEFFDQFSTPRPIIYLRANNGAVANDGTHAVYNSKQSGTYDPASHYDIGMMTPYMIFGTGDKSDFKMASANASPVGNALIQGLFTAGTYGSTGVTARSPGSFLLLDPGADGFFGTADDIVVGGGGGQ